jgi:hypothetical protein
VDNRETVMVALRRTNIFVNWPRAGYKDIGFYLLGLVIFITSERIRYDGSNF